MTAIAFHHMAIACRDMGVTERFYSRHFGFRRARVIPIEDSQIIFLKAGGAYLELFQARADAPVPLADGDGPLYPGWRHLAFKVDDVDAQLAAMGDEVRITLGPLNFDAFIPGWRSVWVTDPDGNIVEISQGYMDQE